MLATSTFPPCQETSGKRWNLLLEEYLVRSSHEAGQRFFNSRQSKRRAVRYVLALTHEGWCQYSKRKLNFT